MKNQELVSVIINNYNYGKFLVESIESVLSQTYKNYEIIIVDDGSTDNSREIVDKYYSQDKKIKIILKENGGQLSAFNEGFKESIGDIIFFLDSDDKYKSNYLEETIKIYQNNKEYDFIFCAVEEFCNSENIQYYKNSKHNIDFGATYLETLVLQNWIGMQTSAISVRREILEKILPIPYTKDWITRADDCIVFGSSIAGARKYYFSQPLIDYRIHNNNAYANHRKFSADYIWKREYNINKLFNFFQKKLGIPELCKNDFRLKDLIKKEILTKKTLTFKEIKLYLRISRKLNIGFLNYLDILLFAIKRLNK